MEFNRKFYAVIPPTGGGGTGGTNPPPPPPPGPSDNDLNKAEKLKQLYAEMRSILGDISVLWKRELNEEANTLDRATGEIVKNLGKDLYNTLQAARKETNRLSDKTSELRKNVGSSKQIQERINETIRRQNALQELANELSAAKGGLSENDSRYLRDANSELQKQIVLYRKILRQVERQEKAFGALGGLMKTIGGLPFIGPLISQLTKGEKIIESMKKKAQEGGSAMQVFSEGIMQLGANFGVGILGLLAKAFETLVKLAIQFNQKSFDFAKNLGVSVGEAGKLHDRLMDIAHSNFLLSKEVTETYAQLTNTFGFLVPANKAFAETAALVQKRLGASSEQMAALATASVIADKSLAKTYGILQASSKIEGARNKLALTQRQILDGIAKTSATVLLNFKGDIEALSAAIVRATKLGTTLDQVNKQASNLLDFETSIASEIEATVITGRETNLNKARELAMLGKTSELMEELNRQGVTYSKFNELNVFEKEAEAKRIGLTIEEYSKLLLQQKQAQDLGAKEGQSLTQRYDQLMKTVEGQKLLNAQLSQAELTDLKRASIQDKFNTTLEKFKEILGKALQGPVIGMLEKFIAFVNNTEKMKMIAEQIKNVFEGIQSVLTNIPGIMKAAVEIAKVLASISAATAAARIVMAAGLGGPVAALAGIAAGYKFYDWVSGLIGEAMSGGGTSGGGGMSGLMVTGGAGAPMTPPLNSSAAAAEGGRTARGEGRGAAVERATANNTSLVVNLDGQKVGQIVLGKRQNEIYGLNMA